MDLQSPMTRSFSLGHVEHALGAGHNINASDTQGSLTIADGNVSTPGTEAWPQVETPGRYNRPHKRRRQSAASNDTTDLMIKSLSQNVLCGDYYNFLESELPRWAREGLWPETPHKQFLEPSCSISLSAASATTSPRTSFSAVSSSYSKLERAYLAVCQLDTRMSDDVVRNRIALIQLHLEYTQTHEVRRRTSVSSGRATSTVGRGDASHVIDRILENTHGEWRALDQRRRAELRAKFHDRKKYGKRWSQLADALGPGILLVCATRLANAV